MSTPLSITLATRTDHELRHLPAFMEHHMPFCQQAAVYIDLRPGQQPGKILEYLEHRWSGRYRAEAATSVTFDNSKNIPGLQGVVSLLPKTDWVMHLDKDEMVGRPHLISSIVSDMDRRGDDYAEGWMACRFGPGMSLYPDDLPTREAFDLAAPVRVEYIKSYGYPTRKIWLSKWPEVRIHNADNGWRTNQDLMVIDHFTWTHSRLTILKEKILWHLQKQEPEVVQRYVRQELAALQQTPEALEVGKRTLIPRSCGLDGFFDYADFYRKIVESAPEGSTVVELGVYCGKSLCYLAEYATLIGKKLDIVGVDLFDLCERTASHLKIPFKSHDEHLQGVADSCARFAPWCTPRLIKSDTAEAAKLFADASVFAVWVDAGHDVDSVVRDIKAWRPKVQPGGIFAGHDFAPSHPGVQLGLDACGVHYMRASSRSWVAIGA